MGILVLALLLGLIPAAIASGKGYNFFGWWIYGSLLLIIALPHALLAPHAGRNRTCPFCAEKIMDAAKVCPHCQRDLPAPEPEKASPIALAARHMVNCRNCTAEVAAGLAQCPHCGQAPEYFGEPAFGRRGTALLVAGAVVLLGFMAWRYSAGADDAAQADYSMPGTATLTPLPEPTPLQLNGR